MKSKNVADQLREDGRTLAESNNKMANIAKWALIAGSTALAVALGFMLVRLL